MTGPIEGYRAAPVRERIAFNMATATAVTIGAARAVNTMRSQRPVVDALRRRIAAKRHVHHYVPGIALALSSAAVGFITEDPRRRAVLALPFGTGVGLTLDEAAMLFEFQNRYWDPAKLPAAEATLAGITAVLLGIRFVLSGRADGGDSDSAS